MNTSIYRDIPSFTDPAPSKPQSAMRSLQRIIPQGSLPWYPCFYIKHLALHLAGKETMPKRLLPHVVNHNIRLDRSFAIYLYIPKVACSSIKKICAELLGKKAGKGEEIEEIHKVRFPSAPKYKLLRQYGHYFKFAFVRNPWDRLVSCYRDKVRFDPGHVYERYENGFDAYFRQLGINRADLTFPDFVELVANLSDEDADAHFRSQSWFLHDADNRFLPDYVGRFENLSKDFEHVAQILNLKQTIPHLRKTKHAPYTEWYTDTTRQLVAKRYAHDIGLFGYQFGE